MRMVLLLQFAATWTMVGIIWFVQVVHYPLFAGVGERAFKRYHANHTGRTTRVVGPPMFVEAVASGLLLWHRPAAIPFPAAAGGLLLVILLWASTALVQIPLHEQLGQQFDAPAARRLVTTNYLRTAAWSLRGILAGWMVWSAF